MKHFGLHWTRSSPEDGRDAGDLTDVCLASSPPPHLLARAAASAGLLEVVEVGPPLGPDQEMVFSGAGARPSLKAENPRVALRRVLDQIAVLSAEPEIYAAELAALQAERTRLKAEISTGEA